MRSERGNAVSVAKTYRELKVDGRFWRTRFFPLVALLFLAVIVPGAPAAQIGDLVKTDAGNQALRFLHARSTSVAPVVALNAF